MSILKQASSARALTTLAIAALLSSTAAAGESEHIYRTANGMPPGKITFHPNGNIESITGEAICTSSTKVYDGWVTEVTALGLKIMNPTPSPEPDTPEPDSVRYVDKSGNTLKILGVPVVLTRDKSLDAWTAGIAGNPAGVEFFTFVSPQLGPNTDDDNLPLSMEFEIVFEYSDPNNSFRLSQLELDPFIVVTNFKDDNATGGTSPAVIQPSRCRTPKALESSRLGSPANPDVLRAGATSAPILGRTWDPFVEFNGSATDIDTLVVTTGPDNVVIPGMGTLLCSGATLYVESVLHGGNFGLPIPRDQILLGFPMCAQAATYDGVNMSLSNALDIVIGAQ